MIEQVQQLNETDYLGVVRALHREAAAVGQPLNGTFELTERCNLACVMCYIRQPAGDKTLMRRELTKSEWVCVAREARDAGMLFLTLTGGEIFLREDFFDIYSACTELGLRITLMTNAALVSATVADRLAELPPSRIEITLYGGSSASYRTVTGSSASFQRSIAGVDFLLQRGLSVGLKVTLTRDNVDELDRVRQFASERGLSLGASWLLMRRRRDGSHIDTDSYRIPTALGVEIDRSFEHGEPDWIREPRLAPGTVPSSCFDCQAGRASFAISPYGKLNACVDLPQPGIDVRSHGFIRAWHGLQGFVSSAPPLNSQCANCDAQSFCPRCPAWSHEEHGSLNAPATYVCDVADLRRSLFVRRVETEAH